MSLSRTLVAGVGNVFFGDDGFGVEVARRLSALPWPDQVRVGDFGIRGIHLAYELLEGYDTLIVVDAVDTGEEPGTLIVLEPTGLTGASPVVDAHGMDPATVLARLHDLGGSVGRVRVVGCQPATLDEGIGLSEPVTAAVDRAVELVLTLLPGVPGAPDVSRVPGGSARELTAVPGARHRIG